MNIHNKLILSITCVCSLIAGCNSTVKLPEVQPVVNTQPVEIIKSPRDDRAYQYLQLNNQLKVLLVSDPNSEQSIASLSVGVGSYHNPKSQPGLAHFVEHMLFLGSKKYPEPSGYFNFIETKGGSSNAYTAKDHTNYYFSIPNEHYQGALDRFSDYFKNPLFAPVYVDKERTAVDNEWSKRKSHDGVILQRVRAHTGNPQHPSSQISVGNLQTLTDKPNSKLLDEAIAFYKKHYSANQMNLVLAGPQNLAELAQLAKQHFADINNNQAQTQEISIPGITADNLNQHIYYQPQQTHKLLFIEFALQDNSDDWQYQANRYLSYILSSEEPGTLGEYLRKQNLAISSSVQFAPDYYGKDGFVQIHVSLTDSGVNKVDQIIAATLSYINLIRTQGINQQYYQELAAMAMDEFNNNAKGNLMHTAVNLSAAMFDVPPQNLLNRSSVFAEFNPSKIEQVLAQMTVENMRVWHVYPQVTVEQSIPHYDGKYAVKQISAQEQADWLNASENIAMQLPKTNELFDTQEDLGIATELTQPTQIYHQDGIEAWLSHSRKFQHNQGWMELIINTDVGDWDGQYKVASRVFLNMFEQHLIALRDKASRAGIDIHIQPYWGGSMRFKIQGKSAKHLLLAEQLLQALVNYQPSKQEFNQALTKYQEQLANKALDTPAQQAQRLLTQLVYTALTDDQLLQASKYVNLAVVNKFKQQLLNRNKVLIFAFGAYRQHELLSAIDTYSQILPAERKRIDRYKKPLMPIHAGEQLNFSHKVKHTDHAVLDAFIAPRASLKDSLSLKVLNNFYHSAFFAELRTEEQLGYQVSSMAFDYQLKPIFAMLVQSNNTNYKALKKRMDKFRKDFASKINQLTQAEFEQARDGLLSHYQQAPNNLYEEAGQYVYDFFDNQTQFDSKKRSIELLQQLTLQDIQQQYRNMIVGNKQMELLIQLRGSKSL
ncbi:peptidase, M16 (pitrilysin) family protein [Catenovulum agarivorans DS-2]|uniref:Protease 3 n=1 Tax=Catenovulum agarivorans DS-2 TaxID=1328313 RepID=W7QJ32_9ALTE|nr:insulinase family protein [Catenovulum agarivorans]EWH08133.1 peptidase, M16 (pitrilysin) family protein [Catenovulum agarivorans DS-2]